MSFEPLPKDFTKRGFRWITHKRVGDVVLLQQIGLTTPPSENWVTIIVQKQPASEIAEKAKDGTVSVRKLPAKEIMPGDTQWGTFAWTYMIRENAEAKFDYAVEREKQRALRVYLEATPKAKAPPAPPKKAPQPARV